MDHTADKNSKFAQNHQSKTCYMLILAYFLWADAVLGKKDTKTALSSPVVTSFQKICFTFWFDLSVSFKMAISNMF